MTTFGPSDNLKIPYKFQQDVDVRRMLRRSISKHSSNESFVTADELERILVDFVQYNGERQRQNWLEIERHNDRQPRPGSTTLFDAIIDPIADADPVAHIYPSLGSLVNYESWDDEYVFAVGVRNRPGETIVETGCTVPGPLHVEAIGGAPGDVGTPYNNDITGTEASRPVWDIRGAIDFNGSRISVVGMYIYKSTSGNLTRCFEDASARLENCVHQSDGNASGTRNMANIAENGIIAFNTGFLGTAFSGQTAMLFDCAYGTIGSSQTISSDDFFWIGGGFTNPFGAETCTFAGDRIVIITSRIPFLFAQENNGAITFQFNDSDSDLYFDFSAGQTNAINVTVSSNVDHAVIKGVFNDVTISGNSDAGRRKIDCTVQGTADITGPCNADISGGASAALITLKGDGVRANVRLHVAASGSTTGQLKLVGCNDSLVTATLTHGGTTPGTSQPYNIDNASNRSILIVSGSNNNWGAAGVNNSPGGSSIVIDETQITP